jgi:hypothetical protein
MDASIYSFDAQKTLQYGRNIGKPETDTALQFAIIVTITMDYVAKLIAHYPFHAEVVKRYGEEKAAKFFAAYYAFMDFHQPFRNDTHHQKKRDDFYYAIGYKRKPKQTQKKKPKKKLKQFDPHYRLYKRLLKSKLKKYQELNDTEIIKYTVK